MLGRNRALLPRKCSAEPAIIDQRQPLALEILELQRQPAVDVRDIAHRPAARLQPFAPETKRLLTVHSESGPRHRARTAHLALHRPVEESDVGAGTGLRVGIEQVVGADVVLVDGLLHQAQPHGLGVEFVIAARIRRHGRQMMNSGQLHDINLAFDPF